MCGISMILDFDRKAQPEHIQQMMNAIKHRGPDAESFLKKPLGNGNLFLGSNRLKIIDRDNNSNQPFISADGRYTLIFNGEIYNYEDLRNELLSSGKQFITRSDTEVLLYWLVFKGAKGISQLNGMFAFIFVDFKTQKIIVGRDPLGIKPLFVHQGQNQFCFSSEIHGILASGLIKKELNKEAIPHYLAYKYAPRPATFYKGIDEFMPGTIWQINANGNIEKSSFQPALQEANTPINKLLIDAVVQQYSEPNNAGIMLSGGVDSTLLLAILNKELGHRNIPVFSVASKGNNKFDTKDGSFSIKAAKLYQAEYNEISIDERTLDNLDSYIETLGQPIADSGGFLTWLIAKKAKGKSKVLLSGAGADELFAGYNRHIAFYNYLKIRDKKWFNLIKQGKKLPSFLPFFSSFKKFANAISANPSTTFNNFIQSDAFRIKNKLWSDNLSNEDCLRKALEHDQNNYLSADVLAITDQATMQHSIEARVPYLDYKLVKASQDLPTNKLLKNGTKGLLKKQLVNYGGKEFAHRTKQGFGLPMNNWLKADSLWGFNENDNLIHQFVSKQKITTLLNAHISSKADLTQELWRILLLHKWLVVNF